ncbi:MAG: HAD family phosphatase [Anaerolineae bacterium]|nr:HAD family phosphatase [Anaerolineae bacterium]
MSNEKPTAIKLIVTDVDGTLLNSEHKLSERNAKALKDAAAQGIHIVLATGKSQASCAALLEELKIPAYGIYLQGLTTVNAEGKVMSQRTLDPDVSRQVITYADERGFSLVAYSGQRLLARATNPQIEEYTVRYHDPMPEAVGPLQNVLWTTPIHKLTAIGEPRAIMALRWQLNTQLGGTARLMQAGVPNMLEILPPSGGKGAALKALLKELQVPSEQAMAIGDAENDIEMLEIAGVSIAVGNADQKVKDAAGHVVASNDEDGVAEAIERYALPQPASDATASTSEPSKTEEPKV